MRIKFKIYLQIFFLFIISNKMLSNEMFNKFFTVSDSINLNLPGLLIGDISEMIKLSNGKIVIIDNIAKTAYWVNFLEKSFKKIDVSKVKPGYKFWPSCMVKDLKEGFWITSFPNIGEFFKFNDDGIVEKVHVPSNNTYFNKFFVDDKSNIISYYITPDKIEFSLYNINYPGSRILISMRTQLPNAIYRFEGGGIIAGQPGEFFFMNALENTLYKMSHDGEILDTFKNKNSKFNQLEKDIDFDKENIMMMMKSRNFGPDLVLRVFKLNESIIIAFEIIESQGYLEFFSIKDSVKQPIRKTLFLQLPGHLVNVENNVIYIVKEYLNENTNDLNNPSILLYKFIEKF